MSVINDVLVNKLFKDPPKRTKEIPLLSEKTASGDGMVVINDAYSDFPIKNLTLQGNTKQEQTTGAQLFDANKMNGLTKSGITVSVKDGMITATGMATKDEWIQAYVSVEEYKKIFKPGEKIFIKSYKTTDCNYDFGLYGAHGSPILGTVTEGNSQPNGTLLPTIYPARDTDFYFFVSVKQDVTLKGSLQPMVYKMGNGTYEPYTGGKPSPSPEYPQEIVNSGRLNEDTGKYEVEVTINSSNLFKVTEHTTGYYTVEDGKVQFNKSIGYSWAVVVNNLHKQTVILHITTAINTRYRMYCTDLEDTLLYKYEDSSANANDNSHTFNMPDGAKKIYVSVMEINSAEQAEIALNLGNTALPFEPYKEQTVTLTSERPITKWDKLVEKDGVWGWVFQSKRSVLNEKSVWDTGGKEQIDKGNYYFVTVINDASGENQTSVCKTLKNVNFTYGNGNIGTYGTYCDHVNLGAGHKFFRQPNESIRTLDEWKAWLAENPIEILYKTKESEFVPLPQDEQNAIRALKTYYPTTVITVDGGELPVGIEVTYMHPEYIPTKQSALRMWFKENPII